MAVGNTFGATALSSYGGFWIAYAILLTPAFHALDAYEDSPREESSALGFFLMGWFIFTFLLLLCTLRSTVMFFLLFFTLALAFLMLACADFAKSNGNNGTGTGLQKAGGVFGLLAAFIAWYNAFAGIADSRYVKPYAAHLVAVMMREYVLTLATATRSSPSPSSTSRGPRRVARRAPRPSARPSKQQKRMCNIGRVVGLCSQGAMIGMN